MPQRTIDTSTGPFTITEENGAITGATWGGTGNDDTPVLHQAETQVAAYFAGTLQDFALPLHIKASQFQRDVCAAMQAIPFGDTTTYGAIAKALDAPAQAIGQACGANPIALIIPCHRVLAATGLGGFSGTYGIETKIWLLKHEGAASLLI